MDKERCLLCQCKIEEQSPESPLEVIFLLRKVLGVPADLLSKFRRGCPNLETWISVCEQCQALVRECHQIYEQLCHLTRKWNEGQARIWGIIRDVKLEGEEEDEEVEVLDIGREVRIFVQSNELQDGSVIPLPLDDDLEDTTEQLSSSPEAERDPLGDLSSCSAVDSDEGEPVDVRKPDQKEAEEESDSDWEWETPDDRDLTPPHQSSCAPPEEQEEDKGTSPPNDHDSAKPSKLSKNLVQLRCPVSGCSRTFPNPNNRWTVLGHRRKAHTPEQMVEDPHWERPFIYQCRKCGMVFNNTLRVRRHLRVMHASAVKAGRVHCLVPGCSTISPTSFALRNHQRHCHTPQEIGALPRKGLIHECLECGERVVNRTAIWKHHQRKHAPRVSKERMICDICGALVLNLGQHKCKSTECRRLQGRKVEDELQICPECGKSFRGKLRLRYHFRMRHEATPLQCAICGQTLSDRTNLNSHMAAIHGQGDFLCDLCPRVFSQERALRFHVDFRHKGIGGHACGESGCGKRFETKRLLENHVNQTHLKGEPGYKCAQCGKGFYFNRYLAQHKRLVHRGVRYTRNRNPTSKISFASDQLPECVKIGT